MCYSDCVPKESFITPEINLIPEDDLESRPGGRFLKWALSWGKKIVVLTELMVVMAFLSRFWLDSEVATQSEEIDRRKTIIQASAEFEKEFRSTKSRIEQIKKATTVPSPVKIYDTAKTLISSSIAIKQVTINGIKISVQGSGDDKLISSLVAAFKNSPDFEDVILEKVSKQSTSQTIEFSLTALYSHKS